MMGLAGLLLLIDFFFFNRISNLVGIILRPFSNLALMLKISCSVIYVIIHAKAHVGMTCVSLDFSLTIREGTEE